MEEDILEFSQQWLTLDKYPFKIITMVTVLADNQKAYRGKLSDLCQYLLAVILAISNLPLLLLQRITM